MEDVLVEMRLTAISCACVPVCVLYACVCGALSLAYHKAAAELAASLLEVLGGGGPVGACFTASCAVGACCSAHHMLWKAGFPCSQCGALARLQPSCLASCTVWHNDSKPLGPTQQQWYSPREGVQQVAMRQGLQSTCKLQDVVCQSGT